MSRYIDADALFEKLEGSYLGAIGNPTWDDINSAPSIDIVQCKECRYWSGCKDTMHNHRCRRAEEHNLDYWTRAYDFCSWGERNRQ